MHRSQPLVALGVMTCVLIGGCTLQPQRATQQEVRERVRNDAAQMYKDQATIQQPISLEEAVARALKYNLDYRLKKMESALALGLADYSRYDMLPDLLVNAGYRTRNNYSGGAAIGIDDGIESLRPSSSEDRTHRTAAAEFSWNLLDFGVSYYRAREQADQFLIAEERRRKVIQNMVQDVGSAYWRALGAQRMASKAAEVMQRSSAALERSREAESQHIIAPALALNYQRALLDATSLLNLRRQDLEYAKRELAALMNIEPGVNFTIAEAGESPLPATPTDVAKLEEMALLQRPELREEDFKKRITAAETRRQILGLLPGISFDAGRQYDTNHLLAYNTWTDGGVRISWNLLRLASLPSMKKTQQAQAETDQARRLALAMAVLTQVRIGVERYRFAVDDFKLANQAAQVDQRLADNARATVTARLDSELEAVRTHARAVLSEYQRAYAYANAQIAFGRLYSTLGLDPLPDNFDGDALPILTERVRAYLQASQTQALQMSSQLFGFQPVVSLQLRGIVDPLALARLQQEVAQILERNQVRVAAGSGTPLTLTLSMDRQARDGRPVAACALSVGDAQGRVIGHAEHASAMPDNGRESAYEAALIATLTANLPQLQGWLAQADPAAP